MHRIDKAAGQIIAADTQSSVGAIDKALMSNALLCASIVEVNGAANLPVTTSQSALESMAEGLTNLIQSRGNIADATRELLKIQKASSLRETSFGCPNGLPPKTGSLEDNPTSKPTPVE